MLRWTSVILLAACGRSASAPTAPVAFHLPESTHLVDGATGADVATAVLLRRIAEADFVLLGEVHDNAVDHGLRGALITAFASRSPAVVFEQLADGDVPIPGPAAGDSMEAWLDGHGFDRRGWRWPLHQPVVDAALAHGRSVWGSNLSREALRSVVMQGEPAAPPALRALMARTPLDSTGTAALDQELVESHCGQLPASMVAGMRTAQVTRDAAMAQSMVRAHADGRGPVWLIAGNGHVNDRSVPRFLPRAHTLAVGLLERDEHGADPSPAERRAYDLVIITPRAEREDPCAGM